MITEPFLQIRSRPWAYDFILCAVVAVLSLTAYARTHSVGPGLVAGLLVVAPLMLRRLLPELALATGVAGALGSLVVFDPPRLCMVAVPLLVYSLARFASPRTGQLALIAGLAGSLLGPGRWLLDRGIDSDSLLVLAVATAACAAITTAAYLTGRRRREGQENSADRAQSAAERERLIAAEEEQRTRMATVAERNRIARELHDIVAHSLSVIVVQAEGGRALATRRPEKGPEVLGTIAETSRQALEEMRRMVGLLRSGGADAGPSYAPAPGLDDIGDLVSRTSESVELTSYGTVPTVSPALGLTAYRIVQESLTNVLKHAGPAATARVTLAYTVDSIEIEVADNGRGAAAVDEGLGHGLQGMAERVALHGGTLIAEPRPGGGFVVRASLPQAGRMTAIRVFLVDDQALVRSGFRMLLEAEDDIEVVGEAADGSAALQGLAGVDVDVVLMDIRMPRMDGVEATQRLAAARHPARILVLTTFDLDEYVFAALKAGASGFLLKDARPDELLGAIRSVAAGDAVVAPSATRRLLAHVVAALPGPAGDRTPDDRLALLTSRELEVLAQIAAGATNTEIGARLYMAEGTVKTHIGRLLAKLGVRDRVGLVLFAYETGLVER